MGEEKTLKAGDPCPVCGGAFVVDPTQTADALIAHHKRVASVPQAAARYAEATLEKELTHGVLHVCARCGYHARFKRESPDGPKKNAAA